MKPHSNLKTWIAGMLLAISALAPAQTQVPDPATMQHIKAYCLDFNWQGSGRKKKIADPGFMSGADPKAVVAWHKAIGCNVIQTFCVSLNGYAWYRNGTTPEQPDLKQDFLRDVVKLGHAEGMAVMGYFCIAANTRWGSENPDFTYGLSGYHLPYTDEYLAYLTAAITDAVATTGIDGFMVDWIWQPDRKATGGQWIDAEKKLYQQLMGEPFPGEDKLTAQQDLEYSRRAIDRCWKTIRKAAKAANPKCIIWLTCNQIHHPHIKDSDMFREVDWLMAETGDNQHLEDIRNAVGKHTRLLTCLAAWNNADAAVVIPDAQAKGIGLYGFCMPGKPNGTIPLEKILTRQLSELVGDDRNIGALARAYSGRTLEAEWNGETFVEPEPPPAMRIHFKPRRRGWQDTGSQTNEDGATLLTIQTPHFEGQSTLTRIRPQWPTIRVRLQKKDVAAESTGVRITNGTLACEFPLAKPAAITWGTTPDHKTGDAWKFTAKDPGSSPSLEPASVEITSQYLEFTIPQALLESNPDVIVFEWLKP